MYKEEDFLMISGIQHFAFCRRQWALIHLECQWQENLRTVDGNIIHEHCHDEAFTEKRQDLLISRGMRVFSAQLGAAGQCDVVEFRQGEHGTHLHGREGLWNVTPIEYKRGQPKTDDVDILQLCAQALCLEEMLCCEIAKGYLFYDEIHRRDEVLFSAELRARVTAMFREMHEAYGRGTTPKVKPAKHCQACSLKELCLPRLCRNLSVADYHEQSIGDE